jgi:hypothetical protein
MTLIHAFWLFFDPKGAWDRIHAHRYSLPGVVAGHTLVFALIPVLAAYYGTTRVGWEIGGDVVRITVESARNIAVLSYLAILASVASVGYMIFWMSQTYGARQPLGQCVALATFTVTPLFLVGVIVAYPLLWLNMLVGLPALAYTIFLFFTGVPRMMEVPEERAFLFASAVLAFGLVTLVALLAVSVILWGVGLAPEFVRR